MKGIYLLHIVVEGSREITVGSLGRIAFGAGAYVYVGSAQSGLEKRIARHLRKRKRRHWHIDHLLSAPNVRLDGVVYAQAGRSRECEVARLLATTARPVRGFGSSDCACVGHLFGVASAASVGPRLAGLRWHAAGHGGTHRLRRGTRGTAAGAPLRG